MQTDESVWDLREWLCGVAERVQRRCRRGRADAEDAAHDVLVRAAERRWGAGELRARAEAEVGFALDRQSEAMRKRRARGQGVVVEMSVLLADADGQPLGRCDPPPLADAFPDAVLGGVAVAVLAGATYRDLCRRYGKDAAVALTRRLKREVAAWRPGCDPDAPRQRRNQPRQTPGVLCRS